VPPAAGSTDDAELARRALVGDADAFVQIVRRHQAAAIRLARVLGPPDDAEDAAQEAFMKAHRALADTTPPGHWVRGCWPSSPTRHATGGDARRGAGG
jgi:DNA-directed RNA polymerase specialized sigma24 family protein